MSNRPRFRRLAALLLVASSALVIGCGSSKPAYCSKVDDLKKSVQNLANINVREAGVGSLSTAFQNVQTNANAAVGAAKTDFPAETAAVSTSVQALGTSISSLGSKPTRAQLSTVASNVSSTVNAVNSFASVTASKC